MSNRLFQVYRELCRQKVDPWFVLPESRCILDTVANPIKPNKVEIFSHDPLVVLIHDVLGKSKKNIFGHVCHFAHFGSFYLFGHFQLT